MAVSNAAGDQPRFPELDPDKALIFRITHRDNVAWVLDHGLHCETSSRRDPDHVDIGSAELIAKRRHRRVPVAPFGPLSDYVPFYFTPRSPMLLNILTGRSDVRRREAREIVVIVTSLTTIAASGSSFVYTDRHAYLETARFFNDLVHLNEIRWDILRASDYRRDPDDPDKLQRYQAEALVHKTVRLDQLRGIACYDAETKAGLTRLLDDRGMTMPVFAQPRWYRR